MKLRFGIPSLDDLVEVRLPSQEENTTGQSELDETNTNCATSMAILGPDGVGKSVFALHLASRYLADCIAYRRNHGLDGRLPLVLYVSSDFRHDRAQQVWTAFKLGYPNSRQIPFERTPHALERMILATVGSPCEVDISKIRLEHLLPFDHSSSDQQGRPKEDKQGQPKEAVDFIVESDKTSSASPSIGFIDLARYTAGDDWNFTNSILSKLASIPRFKTKADREYLSEQAPHLVIIDSVAGFETYTGEIDAYGVKQSRRARIAQSLRNAGIHSHLVFVVEEPKERGTFPEEYVTDVVLRLRAYRHGDAARRTVEVEKARARSHALGEHPFEIRNRDGSSTGEWENPDAPRSGNAYVQVFHSLPHRAFLVAMEHGKGKSKLSTKVSRFGIPHLDSLLNKGDLAQRRKDEKQSGLRAGSTSGIVGEASTGKSQLAEKFIAEGFRPLLADAIRLYFFLSGAIAKENEGAKKAKDAIARICTSLSSPMVATDDEMVNPDSEPTSVEVTEYDFDNILVKLENSWRKGRDESRTVLKNAAAKRNFGSSVRIGLSDPDCRYRAMQELRAKASDLPKSKIHVLPKVDFPKKPDSTDKNSISEFVRHVFRHPNLRSPGVLLTTGDRNTATLLPACFGRYLKESLTEILEECLGFHSTSTLLDGEKRAREQKLEEHRKAIEPELETILMEQIVVRRFDASALSAAELFHLVQQNVIEAQRLIHGTCFPFEQARRFPRAGRVRVVIDDLQGLANLCPDLVKDSSFLPFLTFFLEREGVTTLFVQTESVRPFAVPADPLARMLQPLLQHTIITWGVPFQGRNRVAICVVPPGEQEYSGVVRELQMDRGEETNARHMYPWVSRNFELYSGIEKGIPRLVPLSINLYAPTEGFRRYIDQEERMYSTQFVPVGASHGKLANRVISPVDASEYYALRDLTHLPWDAKAHYTIIDQVDAFWSLDVASGSLSSQREYLMSPTREANEDRFRLFTGKPFNANRMQENRFQRRYFFQNSGYKSRVVDWKRKDPGSPDRVPYMWDFGFLLVPAAVWDAASSQKIERAPCIKKRTRKADLTVGEVQRRLLRRPDNRPENKEGVTWREFFGACKVVAEVAHRQRTDKPVPFDFAGTTAETLSAVFLEIWFSEYDLAIERLPKGHSDGDHWKEWLKRITSTVYTPTEPSAESQQFSLRNLLAPENGKPRGPSDRDRRPKWLKRIISTVYAPAEPSAEASPHNLSTQEKKTTEQPAEQTEKLSHEAAFAEFKNAYENLIGVDHAAGRRLEERPDHWKQARAEKAHQWEENEKSSDIEKLNENFAHLNLAALTLYKTWLLLLEVLDFESVLDSSSPFEMKLPKENSPHAIAAHHYYRTACEHQRKQSENQETVEEGCYVLAVPGKFVVRGDSFLASPKASRSRLAASYAMDILSSRRANLTRMQMGLGLPVRDVLSADACDQMRTALRARIAEPSLGDPADGLHTTGQVPYKQLYMLGGPPHEEGNRKVPEEWPSSWFHRNGIPEYDRISRVLQRWIVRLFRLTVTYRAEHSLTWDGGFFAYDALDSGHFAPLINHDSFTYFGKLCDYLCDELEAAERVIEE
ncbi:MAG TPA: ATPase domain-containing protein [Bryobacteraceae bacterium]|jgi:KaiC/GvpD/RAD55 family RecA-like ATPase|nr:ATPase domain-containing protein [Bryobacteraceae bacterium]